jgi:hypothetical protein
VETELLFLFLAGAIGSLIKDIVEDKKLVLPQKSQGELSLGFLSGVITGGVAGYLIDGSITAAFLAGYAGTAIFESLLSEKQGKNNSNPKIIEAIIRYIAKEETVDPDLAVKVAKCESNLSPSAINVNKDGSRDRGLFQINDKWHPEIDDATAFDIVLSTRFFCKAFKEGHLDWWDSSKKCWG